MLKTLLIATVGGAPEPIVAAIKISQPSRIVFICSDDSSSKSLYGTPAQLGILSRCEAEGLPLDPGRWREIRIPDAQDLTSQVRILQEQVTPEVEQWRMRGPDFQVVLDITGGTKCMSVALGLFSRRWPCSLEYVGGDRRTKDDVGIVMSGREQVFNFTRPWDALGYQVFDEAAQLFDESDCRAALGVVQRALPGVSDTVLKRSLQVLRSLLDGYAEWDSFQHAKARAWLEKVASDIHSLRPLLSDASIGSLLVHIRRNLAWLQSVLDASGRDSRPSREIVFDLLANAGRRFQEGRYDDAAARCYRAIEAFGQWRMESAHGIRSSHVFPESLPEGLRTLWAHRFRGESLKLGLQETWHLLAALGDPASETFIAVGLAGKVSGPLDPTWGQKTILVARNSSILAHGFGPIAQEKAAELCAAALNLSGASRADLPQFPNLRRAESL